MNDDLKSTFRKTFYFGGNSDRERGNRDKKPEKKRNNSIEKSDLKKPDTTPSTNPITTELHCDERQMLNDTKVMKRNPLQKARENRKPEDHAIKKLQLNINKEYGLNPRKPQSDQGGVYSFNRLPDIDPKRKIPKSPSSWEPNSNLERMYGGIIETPKKPKEISGYAPAFGNSRIDKKQISCEDVPDSPQKEQKPFIVTFSKPTTADVGVQSDDVAEEIPVPQPVQKIEFDSKHGGLPIRRKMLSDSQLPAFNPVKLPSIQEPSPLANQRMAPHKIFVPQRDSTPREGTLNDTGRIVRTAPTGNVINDNSTLYGNMLTNAHYFYLKESGVNQEHKLGELQTSNLSNSNASCWRAILSTNPSIITDSPMSHGSGSKVRFKNQRLILQKIFKDGANC